MKKGLAAIILTLFPSAARAEGQAILPYIIDAFYLSAILFTWFVLTNVGIWVYELLHKDKLAGRIKRWVWVITGLCSLFLWSMLKYDPHPYEGPIDALFK